MNFVLLSLGSNIEDRRLYLQQAIFQLQTQAEIQIEKISAFYETEPFGVKDQAAFLNAALCLKTSLSPDALLKICQAVENMLGRKRDVHWGPRTMDIDILYYDGVTMNTDSLVLPHPYLARRRFVLVPLLEVWTGVLLTGKTVQQLLDICEDTGAVTFYCPAAKA